MAQKSLAGFFNRKSAFTPFELLPDAVAKHMSTSFLQLAETTTAAQAVELHSAWLEDKSDEAPIYLVDEEERFSTILTAGNLRQHVHTEAYLSELSEAARFVLKPEDSADQAAQLLIDEHLVELPVIRGGRLVGVLTAEEAGKIRQQAAPKAAKAAQATPAATPASRSAQAAKKSSGFFPPLRSFFGAPRD